MMLLNMTIVFAIFTYDPILYTINKRMGLGLGARCTPYQIIERGLIDRKQKKHS